MKEDILENDTIMPNDGKYYDKGSVVTLEAIPNSGYKFISWAQELSDGSITSNPSIPNPLTITVDKDVTYYAIFKNQIDDLSKDYLIF